MASGLLIEIQFVPTRTIDPCLSCNAFTITLSVLENRAYILRRDISHDGFECGIRANGVKYSSMIAYRLE
jgi:hypothetical protein